MCIQLGSGGGQPNISQEKIRSLRIPAPPPDVQLRIASFLDRKIIAIDALIAKKERVIELLQEKRQALITHAVTKGLDPHVSMKASRNPFLEVIPRHWEPWTVRDLLRMRHLEVQDGNHGELHPVAADYVDDGIPFLMANNVRGGKVESRRMQVHSPESGGRSAYRLCVVRETFSSRTREPWERRQFSRRWQRRTRC